MEQHFNGLGMHLGNLSRLSNARTRSISAENPTGAKGRGGSAIEGTGANAARDLGLGWKISPSVVLSPQATLILADIREAGAIQHLWMTTSPTFWRQLVLRAYWDGEESPSIECPYGDFFVNGWCERCHVNSLPIVVNPAGGMNAYWEMPFRKSAQLTIENLGTEEVILYYQIDYTLTDVPTDAAYFHAQWRRSNPLGYKEVHTLLDDVQGKGQYVGTYLAWQSNSNGWWGEGEIKFYLDGDQDFPTICGTGTEDYFGGAWGFEQPKGAYALYSTRSSSPTGLTAPNSVLACIAGISWTPFALRRRYTLPFRHSDGVMVSAICHCRTILLLLLTGIKLSLMCPITRSRGLMR